MATHLRLRTLIALSAPLMAGGCSLVLGLGDYQDTPAGSSGGGGSGGAAVCKALVDTKPCPYKGPNGTENKGICQAGKQTCNADGTGFDACEGEIVPAAKEDCGNALDDDCNGVPNDNCPCTAGVSEDCYSGPAATQGVGACHKGTHTCNSDGQTFSPCTDEVTPKVEDCTTADDDDCDGTPNQVAVCICVPGTTANCYTGTAATQNVGACKDGLKTCDPDGKAYGACAGEVTPIAEDCATLADDNCDGVANEASAGCTCIAGTMSACYGGPAGTQNVGVCKGGMWTCNANGMGYGPCVGEITPVAEDCTTPADDDCNGTPNQAAAGCVCAPGTSAACYTGPAGTQNVGACHDGMKTCNADGKGYGACAGEQVPAASDDCSNAVDEDCSGYYCTQAIWSKTVGDPNTQTPSAVATDAAGNIYVTGQFKGNLPFTNPALISSGGYDVFLVKLGPTGNVLWNKQFGNPSDQYATEVAVDSAGNVVITGYFAGTISFNGGGTTHTSTGGNDIFVAKFDATGAYQWSKAFGETAASGPFDQMPGGLAVDPLNNVIIAGQFSGNVNFGAGAVSAQGSTDTFVTKLTSSGALSWAKYYGKAIAKDVAVDSAGNIAVVGDFYANVNFTVATLTLSALGAMDVFLLRLDSSGTPAWAKGFGNGGIQSARGIDVDSTGSPIIMGSYAGTLGFGGASLGGGGGIFLAKFNSQGAHQWSKSYDNPGGSSPRRVTVDSADGVLFSGSCISSVGPGAGCDGEYGSPFLVKTSSAGATIWAKTYGFGGGSVLDVASSSPGVAVVVAGYYGTIDFGNGPLNGPGYDVGVASISAQ